MRANVLLVVWFCSGALLIPSHVSAQQNPPPVPLVQTPPAADPLQSAPSSQAPVNTPPAQPAPAFQTPDQQPPSLQFPDNPDQPQQPAETPAATPPATDPATGLPLSPDQQREKEIDKYDPLKKDTTADQPDANSPTDRKPPAAAAGSPVPGVARSSAGSGQDLSDPDSLSPNSEGYTGPGVLTRDYTLARPMVPRQMKFVPSFGFSFARDQGQSPAVIVADNPYASVNADSYLFNWSLSGRHVWKHDQVGLDYQGNYSRYSVGNLSGMNNSLNLDYAHAVSRRVSFQLVESVQDLSQNYSLGNPALPPDSSVANINLSTSPNVQLLNSTVRQSQSSADMTFHQTSRLSYNASVAYFIIGRSGVGIAGMTGQQFSGDINYRWTRRATVGVYYSYTNYQYSHNISQADSHGVGMIYSYALNARTQLRTRFGVTRIESLSYESVPLSPALAFILGQTSTVINAYSLDYSADVSAELVRSFGRARSASLAYAHGESPGNGVLLTSIQQTASAGYNMSLFGKALPVSLGAVYSTLSSVGQSNIGNYRSETAYVGISRPITRQTNGTVRVDYSRYRIAGTPLQQHDLRISLGLTWSPPENALRF